MKTKILPHEISSPQDLSGLILELRNYAKWLSHHNIIKHANIKNISKAPILTPAADELIDDKNNITTKELEKIINELESYKKNAQIMTITLAAPPNNDIKKSLVKWCRDNIDNNLLINFQFNSLILGGMILRYKSRIFDWSFKRYILANKSKFPEILRNV